MQNEATWDRILRIALGIGLLSLMFVGPKTGWAIERDNRETGVTLLPRWPAVASGNSKRYYARLPMAHAHRHRFSFDKVEKLDDESRRRRQPIAPVIDALALDSDDVVIDLGAGTGYFALPIAARLGPGGSVIALDVEPRMLDLLCQRAAERGLADRIRRLEVVSQGALPVADASATRALVANVHHELDDPRVVLAELHRALRPQGRIVVVDWQPSGTTEIGPRPRAPHPSRPRGDATSRTQDFRLRIDRGLRRLLLALGSALNHSHDSRSCSCSDR